MNSLVYYGHLMHRRIGEVEHQFHYPIYFFCIDLDDLPDLHRHLPLFSYNRFNVYAIYDKDYLRGTGSIKQNLLAILKDKSYVGDLTHIQLITSCRYFSYAFNPVSFFYCYRSNNELACIVTEVNNTFGERHLYVLDDPDTLQNKMLDQSKQTYYHFRQTKRFHVSPFHSMEGEYQFSFSELKDHVRIQVDLHQHDKLVFATQLLGNSKPLSFFRLCATMLQFPVNVTLTMPRIIWQAAQLRYRKGLHVYMKPKPSNDMTFSTSKPTFLQKICMKVALSFLSKTKKGHLEIILPNHERLHFGQDSQEPPTVKIVVHDYLFFNKVILGGDIGLGESYMQGLYDCNDIKAFMQFFLDNREYVDDNNIFLAKLGKTISRIQHFMKKNTVRGSKKNIQAHYDLSNDFFRLFLDPSMTYSSAIFTNEQQSLQEAQQHKLQTMVNKARIQAGDHVLEIGSGWGSFALEAVRQTGCRVTSITLSEEQLHLAQKRVREAGLQDRIDFQLMDYRDMQGQFDKIVSIEMFEAVGHDYFGVFFQAMDCLLKPNGLAVMQVITIADQRYEEYRKGTDWIQKYIFPGGIVPSLTAMTQAMTRHSTFIIEDIENFGIHYSHTLHLWREQFHKNMDQIKRLGYDESFLRMWEYYLCYCEAGFQTRTLGTLHLVLTRPNNERLPNSVS